MKKIFSNFKGFSLLEALIAMGVMGVVSLGFATLTNNITKTQKRAEIFQNIFSLETRINTLMVDSAICQLSLAPAGNTVIANDKVINIKNRDNTDLYAAGNMYFNNTVQIDSILLKNTGLLLDATSNRKYGQTEIHITYRKISRLLNQQANTYLKIIGPIAIETDATDNLVSCHSEKDNAVETAVTLLCGDVGGIFNVVTKRCDLYGPLVPGSNPLIDPHYVDIDGDTMTGPLTVGGGPITANNGINIPDGQTICVGGRCRDFKQSCIAGEIFRGYNAAGAMICVSADCLPNEYLEGFDPVTGARICKKAPFSACGPGEYVIEVMPDGAATCGIIPEAAQGKCAVGEYLRGYNPDGTKDCVTAQLLNQKCTAPDVLEGFDLSGNPICVTPSTGGITGVEVQEFSTSLSWQQRGSNSNSGAGNGSVTASNYDFCFLSTMGGEDGWKDSSYRECGVRRSGSSWVLRSYHHESRSVMCSMQCINICSGPVDGYWSTTSTGSCSCAVTPGPGTRSVTQTCNGAKCGGSCDPSTRVTSQACFCAPPCTWPNVICPAFGGACVPNAVCPVGPAP